MTFAIGQRVTLSPGHLANLAAQGVDMDGAHVGGAGPRGSVGVVVEIRTTDLGEGESMIRYTVATSAGSCDYSEEHLIAVDSDLAGTR